VSFHTSFGSEYEDKTMRRVTVAHVVMSRLVKGGEQFLLFPHDRWHRSGLPLLAALTKKIPTGPGQMESTLALLEQEGFAGNPPRLSDRRTLRPFRITLDSPAQGRLTRYKVFPFVARYARGRHEMRIEQQGGLWLTRTEALGHPLLSPTARRVFAQVRRTPIGPLAAGALHGDWTKRLVYARDHDQRAFGPLFEEVRGWLHRRLLASFQHPVDIDDVLSETAVLALAYLPTFDERSTAQAWLARIAHNAEVTILRQRRRARQVSLYNADGMLPLIDQAPAPSNRLESAEQVAVDRARVQEVMQSLPAVQRLAWRLRFEENMEFGEIGEVLSRPRNTVATWLHRARQSLILD
jgi:RNA polymerase sigma-70 factor, ECF subfamily